MNSINNMTEEELKATEAQPQVQEVDRHDERIMNGLKEAPIYKKQGEVRAHIAQGGEEVVTRLADGSYETRNVAKPGDAIVTNSTGEQYIVEAVQFWKRYEPKVGEDGRAQEGVFTAKGYCKAIDNPFGTPITMMASWGEIQSGAIDCKITDTFEPETNKMGGEPYIIGHTEFHQTYKPVQRPQATP
jgi:hypothetical protein